MQQAPRVVPAAASAQPALIRARCRAILRRSRCRAVACAATTFMKFAKGHLFSTNVWPFTAGAGIAILLLGKLSINSDPKARAESTYLTPKHH